jgi:hypothetical protein
MKCTALSKFFLLSIAFTAILFIHPQQAFCQDSLPSGLSIPLTLKNTSPNGALARMKEPVTSGVPLSESLGITDTSDLILLDSQNNAVPAQFTVLSRYGGEVKDDAKPIRWVLLDFQADVPAGSSSTYRLTLVGNRNAPPAPKLDVQESAAEILVDTGETRFTIDKKSFKLLDTVTSKDAEGKSRTVLEQFADGGIRFVDSEGKAYTAAEPETITVEEEGPLRTVIYARGNLKALDGSYFAPSVHKSLEYPRFYQPYEHSFVYYSCRMHFYAGKPFVRIFFTLENNGANGRTNPEQNYSPIQMVTFQSLDLVFNTPGKDTTIVRSENRPYSVFKEQHFTLLQDWSENLSDTRKNTLEPSYAKGPYFIEGLNDAAMGSSGFTHPGDLEVTGKDGVIRVGLRHFSQNFPKKFVVDKESVRIGLWPEEGYYPYCRSEDFPEPKFDAYCRKAGRDAGVYLFDAGRHKTHEFVLSFEQASDEQAQRRLAQFVEQPLFAKASSKWYADSGAFGPIPSTALHPKNDASLAEAFTRYERLQDALVETKASETGFSMKDLRTANPPYWVYPAQNRYFGWMNFGDFLWNIGGPSSLHYDWPYVHLVNYLRTGNRSFFDLGVETTKHRYDIDQYHGNRTDTRGNEIWLNNRSFYESDAHADPTFETRSISRVSPFSHVWNGGLSLYYLMTGDKRALEAAMDNADAVVDFFKAKPDNNDCSPAELRLESWPILLLIHAYRVSGKAEYLQTAERIGAKRMLQREQTAGGIGYFGGGGNTCSEVDKTEQSLTMYMYTIEPLIKLHMETQRDELGDLLIRMADFSRDTLMLGATANSKGQYLPMHSCYFWKESDPMCTDGRPSIIQTTFFPDLFAYVYKITGKTAYLDLARKAFTDSMLYFGQKGGLYISPSTRTKIAYNSGAFPNSETKVHGWLGRTNHIYLDIEKELQREIQGNTGVDDDDIAQGEEDKDSGEVADSGENNPGDPGSSGGSSGNGTSGGTADPGEVADSGENDPGDPGSSGGSSGNGTSGGTADPGEVADSGENDPGDPGSNGSSSGNGTSGGAADPGEVADSGENDPGDPGSGSGGSSGNGTSGGTADSGEVADSGESDPGDPGSGGDATSGVTEGPTSGENDPVDPGTGGGLINDELSDYPAETALTYIEAMEPVMLYIILGK